MPKFVKNMSGSAAVLLAAALWSLSPFLVKLVTIDPVLLPCLRGLMAGLLLLPFIKWRDIVWDKRLPLLLLSFTGVGLLCVLAFRYTAAANATALYYSSPLWIFLITSLSARRLHKPALPSVGLLLLGIIIIVLEPKNGANQFGNLMGVAAGLAFASFALSYNRLPTEKRLSYLGLCNLCSCPLIFLVVLLTQAQSLAQIASYSPYIFLMLLVMAVTQQVVPYYLYGLGLAKLPIFRVSMLSLGEFVLSPVWTLLFLGDVPTLYGLIGWLLILAGLLLNVFTVNREERRNIADARL